MALATVPTHKIEVGTRLRDLTETQVEALVESISVVGLLNPITVYPRKVIRAGIAEDGYGIVAGAHRLEAIKRLGLAEVPAQIVEISELERQIAECDENLVGSVLSKAERATFTRRRKEAYEALYPETAHGATGNGREKSRQVGDSTADRFTADTAVKTGQSERAVQRDAERGAKISEQAMALVKGTKLDTGSYLDKLKTVPQHEQADRVKSDLAAKERKPIPPSDKPRNDFEITNKQHAALVRAWEAARPEARQRFLDEIGAVIDTPIMDRQYA